MGGLRHRPELDPLADERMSGKPST